MPPKKYILTGWTQKIFRTFSKRSGIGDLELKGRTVAMAIARGRQAVFGVAIAIEIAIDLLFRSRSR
jgi:hypothetical protein